MAELSEQSELEQEYASSSVKIRNRYAQNIRKHWMLYVMIMPRILIYIIFKYVPLAGSVIAFQDLRAWFPDRTAPIRRKVRRNHAFSHQ